MGTGSSEPRTRSRTLSAGPKTSAEARWFILEALRAEEPKVDRDMALLLTSEVASNAARHGKEPIDVSIAVEAQGIRVSVFDRGEGFDPARIMDERRQDGGLGIPLLNHLASDWGVDRRQDGTEVWFRI